MRVCLSCHGVQGGFSPTEALAQIPDAEIRLMVQSMTSLDPSQRLTAQEYLTNLSGIVFPVVFGEVLHKYVASYAGRGATPDQKIARVMRDFDTLTTQLASFDAVSELDKKTNCHVIIGSLVVACWRSLTATSAKLTGLDLLSKISELVDDEYKLDRYLPYIISSLSDEQSFVRASALRTLTGIVRTVTHVRSEDLNLFPAYIFPIVMNFKSDPEVLVRVAYSESIAVLAKTAQRFLEIAQLTNINSKEADSTEVEADPDGKGQMAYDVELGTLHTFVQLELQVIMTDQESIVKQTLLSNNITLLCTFFGPQKVGEALLCHMFTLFNEKRDWRLRLAFFRSIVAVATYCGRRSIEQQVLPFIEKCLSDSEEFVVEETITAMTAMIELGHFRKALTIKLVADTLPLLQHPGIWIRYAVVALVAATARTLNVIDLHCTLAPLVGKYFEHPVVELNDEVLLLDALKPGVPRAVYETIVNSTDIQLIYDAILQRSMLQGQQRHPSKQSVLGQQQERWLNQLEGLGMTPDVEQKLLSMEQYVFKVFRERMRLAEDPDPAASLSTAISLEGQGIRVSQGNMAEAAGSLAGAASHSASAKGKGKAAALADPYVRYQADVDRLVRTRAESGSGNTADVAPPVVLKGKKAKAAAEARDRDANALRNWRPVGKMVGHLLEHKGPINALAVMPDQQFFLTGADDATVRVWECSKLEGRVVSNRSRMAYKNHRSKVKHLAVVEPNGQQAVASASADGSIHLFGLDQSGTVAIRQRQVDSNYDGSISDLQSLGPGSSMVLYSTVRGNIYGWDTRTAKDGWLLKPIPTHGLIQACLVDPTQSSLIVGTSRGVYTLWDLRFQLPVKSWLQPGESSVRLLRHFPKVAKPTRKDNVSSTWEPSSWVISAAGPNKASIWDVRSSITVARFCATPTAPASDGVSARCAPSHINTSRDGTPAKAPSSLQPARSAFAFFQLAIQKQKRIQSIDRAMQQGLEDRWRRMKSDERAPFRRREMEDFLRYQDELSALLAAPWLTSTPEKTEPLSFTAAYTHPGVGAVFLGSSDGKIRIWDLDVPFESHILGDLKRRNTRPGSVTSYKINTNPQENTREIVESLGTDTQLHAGGSDGGEVSKKNTHE